MSKQETLTAADGVKLGAYIAEPAGKPKGGLIVCQEIFGVNGHIRSVCDGYAAAGYLAIAPALFDRVTPGLEMGYTQDDIAKGVGIMKAIDMNDALKDVSAAMAAVSKAGKIGIVGYCWGGTVAWAAACRLDGLGCSISYYGGGVVGLKDEKPRCPVLFQFGETDHSISLEAVEEIRKAHPEIPAHLYPAGHGFNCSERGSYHKESAELALKRSLEFLGKHVG